MITFILLGAFFLIVILFAAVAYSAGNRRRSNMRGVNPTDTGQGRAVDSHI